jgi:hypothetical protein
MLPMPEQFARTSPPKYSGGKRSQFSAGEAKRYASWIIGCGIAVG